MMLWPLCFRRLVVRFWARTQFAFNGARRAAQGRCPVCGKTPTPIRRQGSAAAPDAVFLRVNFPGGFSCFFCPGCFIRFHGRELEPRPSKPVDTLSRAQDVIRSGGAEGGAS